MGYKLVLATVRLKGSNRVTKRSRSTNATPMAISPSKNWERRSRSCMTDSFEAEATSRRLIELIHSPAPNGLFDAAHIRAIHRHIFQDVFEWAGRFRTVNISKGGQLFGAAAFIVPPCRILPGRDQRNPPVPRRQRPDATRIHPPVGPRCRVRHRLEAHHPRSDDRGFPHQLSNRRQLRTGRAHSRVDMLASPHRRPVPHAPAIRGSRPSKLSPPHSPHASASSVFSASDLLPDFLRAVSVPQRLRGEVAVPGPPPHRTAE